MKKEIITRKAVPQDANAVYELLKQIASLHRNARPDLFPNITSKYTQEQVHERLSMEESGVFVAVEEKRVVGYIFCDIIEEGIGLTLYIDDLCVDENARRNGVGKMLINAAREYANEKNCRMLMLNVYEFNENAVLFYEKYGFKTRSRHMEIEL